MVRAGLFAAEVAQLLDRGKELRVVRDERAALAGGDDLGRAEREAADVAERSQVLAVLARTE